MKHTPWRSGTFLALFALLFLAACDKDDDEDDCADFGQSEFRDSIQNPRPLVFYALAGNTLDKFSTCDPEMAMSSATITGLQNGETVVGIDFRPLTGQLYALGSNSRVYRIDPATGVATFAFAFSANVTGLPVQLSGTAFGFDFNPQVDRLRIMSNTGQNLRIVPDAAASGVAGTTFTDGSLNPQPNSISAIAYDNNVAGTASTELFALEASTDRLYEIDPPNAGTLIDPLPVGLALEGNGGFDIAPRTSNVTSDVAFALFTINQRPTLFRIDVETGATKILATYNNGKTYTDLAISPEVQ